MAKDENCSRGMLISLLLRIAIVVLFGGMAIEKWIDGPGAFVASLHDMFGPTGFPHWIVTAFGWAIPFIEAALAVWFIVGWRLKLAWFTMGLFVISLGFGTLVLGNVPMTIVNFLFVFYALIGLRVSHADCAHA